MKICVFGAGYVGLVTAACLSELGMDVTCIDKNENKIAFLNEGKVPIYEHGLKGLICKNLINRTLNFTTDPKKSIEASEVIFIAVGTPPLEDGSTNLKYIIQVANTIANYLNGYKIIVIKSTVPVGTGEMIKKIINKELAARKKEYSFDVVSNPEFLKQGVAVNDFMKPDRIILGVESEQSHLIMRKIYESITSKNIPLIVTNIRTAEMIKYASNAFLALKVTYINEIANLCEKVGANVLIVAEAMGRDSRISPKFLKPGPGFGGSCLPKDTKALVNMGNNYGEPVSLVQQTIVANEKQKQRVVDKVKQKIGCLQGKTIGVLGITFKSNTDDLRDAPSLFILNSLAKEAVKIKIFDPQGEKNGRLIFSDTQKFYFCKSPYEAVEHADALVILTDWEDFKNLDLLRIKNNMKDYYFFDFRNMYEPDLIEQYGFHYFGIGR